MRSPYRMCVFPLTPEGLNIGARRDAIARQRLGTHVPAATNTHATIKELLDMVFSVRSMSYQTLSM
jgi:hypothetical protein